MKKVASIVAVALITCSLSACGNRNTSLRNQLTNPGRTNLSIDQRNNVGVGTNVYKDGVYIGEGNNSARGNEAAIVTITNGRISNVLLKSIDNQGREMYSSTANGTINGTTGNVTGNTIGNTTLDNTIDGRNNNLRNNITGNTTGGLTGRNTITDGSVPGRTTTPGGTTPGGNINDMGGNATGRITNDINRNTTGAPTTDNIYNNAINNPNNNALNNNINNNTGRTAATAYDRARQDLAAAIIRNQTHNVNISAPTTETSTINNWKLAVSRALESSKR